VETKNLPVRLSPALYRQLKEMAELHGSTMVDLVRRSLEAFLPALAEAEADAMEQRLQRLRALADERPDYLERSLRQAARAEAANRDPLEEGLVIIRDDPAEEDEATTIVREALGELG
jgi:predicted transcriptional regulator